MQREPETQEQPSRGDETLASGDRALSPCQLPVPLPRTSLRSQSLWLMEKRGYSRRLAHAGHTASLCLLSSLNDTTLELSHVA